MCHHELVERKLLVGAGIHLGQVRVTAACGKMSGSNGPSAFAQIHPEAEPFSTEQ